MVGQGKIEGVYLEGNINPNTDHVFRTDILITPNYYFGGIVGSSGETQLILTDAYNKININGFGTSSSTMQVSNPPTIYIGGVIGKVTNSIYANHMLGLLTNEGEITVGEVKSVGIETVYVGGVVGMSGGIAYEMNLAFGTFTNKAEINVIGRGTNIVNAAGILVSNHTTSTEFVHLFNEQTATLNYYTIDGGSNVTGNFNNLNYTSLIYNIGSGVVLSQSRNLADITIYGNHNYSGVYHSTANATSVLRFVENKGDIIYQNQTTTNTLNIAGISVSENIDYLNVTYDGTIRVSNIVMQTTTAHKELFVAGITKNFNKWQIH